MNYDWSWSVFLDASSDGVNSFAWNLLRGVGWTICLALLTAMISFFTGLVLGVMRTAKSAFANTIATAYVEIFRNIPLLVQMFLWYFVLPEVIDPDLGRVLKQLPTPWNAFVPALLCLCFYATARIGEQVNSGIRSLPPGQFQAAIALGLTASQAYRYVVLPEALRVVIPPLTSEIVSIVKYTSVAYTIGLLELTGQARAMQEFSFHIFEAFTAATVGYICLNGIVVVCMRKLERASAVPGLIGADASSGTKGS
ncbi:amino acid ABC transporter permease [Agrobacterium tumefaciens]|uniref:amino acid ABC transporter permease n=1 Tax=Agrobacterium fabrum TaxID=1176649 RepID=UPI0015733FE8|nr:amino acid ABC transporter permease [Agrobacterium fabrum]NTE84776.1 amino acid ABC transporter permease [Agrobacterium tumefaciens]